MLLGFWAQVGTIQELKQVFQLRLFLKPTQTPASDLIIGAVDIQGNLLRGPLV
jgi:hypothetical protein